jgi:hypothetical protein
MFDQRWKLVVILLICYLNCDQIKTKNYFGIMKQDTGIYKLMVSISWGSNKDQIQPQFIEYPVANEAVVPSRKQYAPILFRLGFSDDVHLLENGYYPIHGEEIINIVHFSNVGIFKSKTPVPKDSSIIDRQIIDFFVDEDQNCYVMEMFKSIKDGHRYNRLYKTNSKGEIIWQIAGAVNKITTNFKNLEGEFDKFLVSQSKSIFVSSDIQYSIMGKFSAEDGAFEGDITFENGSKHTFIGKESQIVRVSYFQEHQLRGLYSFDYKNKKAEKFMGDSSLSEMFLYAFGVDGLNNCYIYNTPTLASISFAGEFNEIEKIENIIVPPTKDIIYTSYYFNNAVYIKGYQKGALPKKMKLDIDDASELKPKLVHVDENSRFYILLSHPLQKGSYLLRIFSEEGILEKELVPSGKSDLQETTLETFPFWNVDKIGQVYFPIVDQQGFKIVRRIKN